MSCSSALRPGFYSLRGWHVVKKKTSWKTLVGLAAVAVAFVRLSKDLPIHDLIEPPEPPFKPTCKDGERLDWNASAGRWVCVPRL